MDKERRTEREQIVCISLSVFLPSDDVIKLLAPLRLFKSVLKVSRETMMLVYQPLARSVTPQADGRIQKSGVFK